MPKPPPSALATAFVFLVAAATPAAGQAEPGLASNATIDPKLAEAIEALDSAVAEDPDDPALYQRRGVLRFFAADPAGAVEDFDRFLADRPEEAPHHWQRGIALYYDGRFDDAVQQFRDHDSVNPRDVENATWLFLCQARAESPEAARRDLIPYRGDARVPMAEIDRLFAGTGSAESVIDAAGEDPNHLCYAHLYLALYHEALSDNRAALHHAQLASQRYRQSHYMGQVAQVHFSLRSTEPGAEEIPEPGSRLDQGPEPEPGPPPGQEPAQ